MLQIWKTQQWPHDWNRSVFIPIPKKGNAKECSNYCTIALISHASKVMFKILQARLQQNVNCELADVQAGFRKDRGTRYQIANIRGKKLKQWETLFWGLKNHCRWLTVALKLKRLFLFGRKVMTNLDSILKKRHYFAKEGLSSQSYGFSSSHVWVWELNYKESWALKNWCFWTVVLEKTPESPLVSKEIRPVNLKGNQSWIFTGRTDAEAETLILWPPDTKNQLLGKDPDTGKDWRWEVKGQRNQRPNCQHPLDHGKSKRVPGKHLFLLYWLCQSLSLCGSQ